MRGRGLVIGVAVVLAGLAVGAAYVMRDASLPSARAPTLKVADTLGGTDAGTQGYTLALEPREFHFPEDHGPHPGFRNEWWYWTGNLSTAEGRDFGYQLTLFRSALAPGEEERASAWGSRRVYMGHLALSDIGGGRFHASERFSRDALGLAGARAEPFRVWLEDWSAEAVGDGALPMRLTARGEGVSLSLVLEAGKPPVLQGDRGLSRKGPEPGTASYYYSLTRMPTRGQVTVDGRAYEVTGQSWMDREWSTRALSGEQVGWDWFALQLSDGSELMYYQLRRRDGTVDPFTAGTLVPDRGEPVRLSREDVRLEVLDTWKSPSSGVTYPARWRLAVPSRGLTLELTPALADQELPVSVRYWEGSVRLSGTHEGRPVDGRGYVELTGYADAPRHGR
ncbi:lipocalin-like domain-containing protein [Vitiosangium sp. GDMCC 1.1324]|uniref:lipocalin-like domain-containing protein n=1 Tax=Vitiosangium sp. (strain GDMCC 1.1324) TaxID=2138576 RepID=UPI000D3D1827|nr:lipocalin-like domain-containing protein [Vitiosangium sp. GDMCC 1.1324]PTL82991.1 carotenoid 1,2-hydratase [Vitiosangium sp. GDMCC 1.1324]